MIPHQIHQLWIPPEKSDGSVPWDVKDNSSCWKDLHPDFSHCIWTLPDLLKALPGDEASCLEKVLPVCRFESMKADLARLFLLHHQGGFWTDLKLRPLCRFLDRHVGDDLLLIEHFQSEFIPDPAGVLVNGFFGCCPKNPFIGECLKRALANVGKRLATTIWEVTGPKLFMDTRDEAERSGQAIKGQILPSAAVWGRLIEIGSGGFSANDDHWSIREQRETMYLDTADRAEAVPVWRYKYLRT